MLGRLKKKKPPRLTELRDPNLHEYLISPLGFSLEQQQFLPLIVIIFFHLRQP